jgi:hypothetical protein
MFAEALSLRDAPVFVVERGFDRVVLEVDCSEMVPHWMEQGSDRCMIKPILVQD